LFSSQDNKKIGIKGNDDITPKAKQPQETTDAHQRNGRRTGENRGRLLPSSINDMRGAMTMVIQPKINGNG
jgi:hypothetical protein